MILRAIGQFKSCFPHHRTLDFSRVLLLFSAFHPNPTLTDLILGWDYTPWDMVG